MTEGLPLELLEDALARIGDDGALAAVTPAMARWLDGRSASSLAQLALDDDQRAELHGGGVVLLSDERGAFELQLLEHGGCSWLRVREVGEQLRASAAADEAARVRSLGRLAGTIAHDLNNQLNAAVGLSSMLSPLARDEIDRESLRSLDQAVMHGARLADMTARLLRRAPDRRASTDAEAVLTDLLTMVKKALDVAEVELALDAFASSLRMRASHDGAVHALMVGVMALLEGRPTSLRIGAFGERRAIADGREREVAVVRLDAIGLPEDFAAMSRRLFAVAPGALGLGAGREAFAGVVGMVATQRRLGGDLVASMHGGVLRLEWLWPRAR